MTGVNALRTITLPAGAAEAVVKISCVNNTSATYPLTIDGNGTEKIFYNATQNLNVNFPYAEQWCELSWDTNDSQWIVNDGSTPLSGTWSGSLDITGALSFPITNLSNTQATAMGLKSYLADVSGGANDVAYNGGIKATIARNAGNGTLSSITRSVLIPYQMQDGTWRLKVMIQAVLSATSRTNFDFTVNGVVFKNIAGLYQSWGLLFVDAAGNSYVNPNTNVVSAVIGTATASTGWYIAGDWELNVKPTWAY